MKMLMYCLAVSLGFLAATSDAKAALVLNVDGVDVPLATLMENCQGMSAQPAAQIACFQALTALLDEQGDGSAVPEKVSVAETFATFQTAAQYQDENTGLMISGAECKVQIVYFNNYFHISRRNVSTIDLFSASFDAAKMQLGQITEVQGSNAPLMKGVMEDGATAATLGGIEMGSAQSGFDAKSPRTSIADYANQVVAQLAPQEVQAFDFVLVHPNRSQASAEIKTAFEAYVQSCQQ